MKKKQNKQAVNDLMCIVASCLLEHKPMCHYASPHFNAACLHFAEKYACNPEFESITTIKVTDPNIAFCAKDGSCMAAVILRRGLDGYFNIVTIDFAECDIIRYQISDESGDKGWVSVFDTYQDLVKNALYK